GHANSSPSLDEDGRGCDKPSTARTDDDRRPSTADEVMPPPLHEPVLEQEGRRARHGPDEVIPSCDRLELVRRRQTRKIEPRSRGTCHPDSLDLRGARAWSTVQ